MLFKRDKMQKLKLKQMAEILSGLSHRRYLDDEGIGYDVVVQRSIKRDGVLSDFDHMNLKGDIKERFFTRTGDVLMKMTYPYDVVCVKRPGLVISDRIAIIRVKEGFDADFIAHMLTNAHIKKQLHQLGSSQKLPHTSLREIRELELIVPDEDAQIKFGELLNTINEKIAEDLKIVEYDRDLKEGILNKLWEESDAH